METVYRVGEHEFTDLEEAMAYEKIIRLKPAIELWARNDFGTDKVAQVTRAVKIIIAWETTRDEYLDEDGELTEVAKARVEAFLAEQAEATEEIARDEEAEERRAIEDEGVLAA